MKNIDADIDPNHSDFWMKEIEKKGSEAVASLLERKSGKMHEAGMLALQRYYKKIQDITDKKNEIRDAETLIVSKNARTASWIAAIASVLAVLIAWLGKNG